jgi:hypothetical protein
MLQLFLKFCKFAVLSNVELLLVSLKVGVAMSLLSLTLLINILKFLTPFGLNFEGVRGTIGGLISSLFYSSILF